MTAADLFAKIRPKKPAASPPEAPTAAPAAEAEAVHTQAPRRVRKLSAVPALVTVETFDDLQRRFDALAAQLEAHVRITALAVTAVGLALQSSPGTLESNPLRRMAQLGAAADFDSAAREQLKSFFAALDSLNAAESRREFREQQASLAPKGFGDYKIPNWRG